MYLVMFFQFIQVINELWKHDQDKAEGSENEPYT